MSNKTSIIGFKELRENADKYISAVEKGRTFTVVRRSKPIFKMMPVDEWGDEGTWETVVDFRRQDGKIFHVNTSFPILASKVNDCLPCSFISPFINSHHFEYGLRATNNCQCSAFFYSRNIFIRILPEFLEAYNACFIRHA